MSDLNGQIAIVTGASGGLGAQFSELLGGHGAAVALAARRLDRLEALEARLRANGIACASFAFDAADADAPEVLLGHVGG